MNVEQLLLSFTETRSGSETGRPVEKNMETSSQTASDLLQRWSDGDSEALDQTALAKLDEHQIIELMRRVGLPQ